MKITITIKADEVQQIIADFINKNQAYGIQVKPEQVELESVDNSYYVNLYEA